MLTFVACSNTGDTVDYIYGVYIKSVSVENGVCTVCVSREENQHLVGKSSIEVYIEQGSFFEKYTYNVRFDGYSIFSAVEEALAQDGTLLNGQEYSTLKIIYDYDTIYKSMKSDGVRTKNNGKYIHSFAVESSSFDVQLTRNVARQSMWYAVAIAGAVVLLGGGLTLTYCRGKYGKKEEN